MVTRRSLNKLERKAHMSIHNTIEVAGNEMDAKDFARDRFGKKQTVEKEDARRK